MQFPWKETHSERRARIKEAEIQAIQREKDKRVYVRNKSIEFLFNRPYAIVFKRNLDGSIAKITYKNYISIVYWIFMLAVGISIGWIAIVGAILTTMVLVVVFYFIRFELRMLTLGMVLYSGVVALPGVRLN